MAGIEVQPQSLAHGMSANGSMQIGSEINKRPASNELDESAVPMTMTSPADRDEPALSPITPHADPDPSPPVADGLTYLLSKRLTSSDSNGAGRVVIPKAAAEEHFPKVHSTSGLRMNVIDSFGTTHTLLLRFWDNKQSRIYILEGTAAVQRLYGITKGDTLTFYQGPDGRLHVEGTRGWQGGDKSQRGATSISRKAKPVHVRRRKLAHPMPAPLATIDVVYKVGMVMNETFTEDGVFRAVHDSSPVRPAPGVKKQPNGRWTAILEFNGGQFQAFFDNENEAAEAFRSAGGNK